MKYSKIFFGGIAATAVMTAFMFIAPLINLPEMDWGTMLGAIFNNNSTMGWLLHFVIGISFAFLYALIFNGWLPVINDMARGALYGIILMVFTEIVFFAINLSGFYTWEMKKEMGLAVFGNMLACFVYGIVLGGIMRDYKLENPFDWERKKYLKFGHHKS